MTDGTKPRMTLRFLAWVIMQTVEEFERKVGLAGRLMRLVRFGQVELGVSVGGESKQRLLIHASSTAIYLNYRHQSGSYQHIGSN